MLSQPFLALDKIFQLPIRLPAGGAGFRVSVRRFRQSPAAGVITCAILFFKQGRRSSREGRGCGARPGPQARQGIGLAPEIIDIRQFEPRALEPLIQAESRVWDAALRWDYSAAAELVATCLKEKRLSGYALVTDQRIQGYSFFFYEGEKGLIGNLFVEPDGPAGAEQARFLLDHVLETMLATPGIRRVETQLPHYSLEDLSASFQTRNFQGYRRHFMSVSLDPWRAEGERPPARLPSALPPDFLMVPWERKHDREAAQLLCLTYRDHVDAAINDQYGSVAGADRLVDNIVRHRGCGEQLPQASQVAIHRKSRKLAGILAITAVRTGTAHIPQVAIAREFQGSGLGTAMMGASLERMARKGFREVSLTVTEMNSGAVRLYERLGFETFRTFGAFVWNQTGKP